MYENINATKIITASVDFLKRVFKPKYVILLAIMGITFAVRSINAPSTITGLDPDFQYRMAKHIADNGFFTTRPTIDTLSWSSPVEPYGKRLLHPPLLHYIIAFFGILVGDLVLVSIWISPVGSVIICILVYKIMSESFDEVTGLSSAFLLGVYGPAVNRTAAGYGDTDVLEMLFIFMIIWTLTKPGLEKGRLRNLLFLGFAIVLLGLSWYGFIIIAAIALIYALVRYHLYIGLSFYLIILGIFNYWLEYGSDAFGAFLIISGILIIPLFMVFKARDYQPQFNIKILIKIMITIFVSIAVIQIIEPTSLYQGIDVGPTHTFVGPTNSELQTKTLDYYIKDIFFDDIGTKWELNVLNSGTLNFMLVILGVSLVLYNFYQKEELKSIELLGFMMALITTVGLTQGHRFIYFFAFPYTIFGGIAVGWIFNTFILDSVLTKKPTVDAVAASTFLFVTSFGLAINATMWSQQYGPGGGWIASFDWLKENTNEKDVVASWWDYGYWIESWAERPVVMDNGHYWGGYRPNNLRFFDGASSFCTTNEYEAAKRLHNYNSSYFLVSDRDADIWGALWYYHTYSGQPHEDLSTSYAGFWKMSQYQTRYSIQRQSGYYGNYTLHRFLWGPQDFGGKQLIIHIYIIQDEYTNEFYPYALLADSWDPFYPWDNFYVYSSYYMPKNIYTFEEVWYGNKTYYMSNTSTNYPSTGFYPEYTLFYAQIASEDYPDSYLDLGTYYGLRMVSWTESFFYKELPWSLYIREDHGQFVIMLGNSDYKVKDSVYAQLFYKDAKNLEYFEKVYGNNEVKIFKINYPEGFVDEW